MAPRNRRCRNCPPRGVVASVSVAVPAVPTTVTVTVASEDEAQRIWNHVQTATALCIGAMEGYVQLKLPGVDRETIQALRDRLNALLDQ